MNRCLERLFGRLIKKSVDQKIDIENQIMALSVGNLIKTGIQQLLQRFGFELKRYYPAYSQQSLPQDFDSEIIEIISKVHPFTQTSPERLFALSQAIHYIVDHQIPGDIVECGVWRGGSMMAVAHTLLQRNSLNRNLYLFDTFEGMSNPTGNDVAISGELAVDLLKQSRKDNPNSIWCYATLEEVKANLATIGYPDDKTHFIKGDVAVTIPDSAPDVIALLRLDTDWYESTRHELVHLFPRIPPGGVIIIDDYGHWRGARQAVDEYFHTHNIKILLNRIDYTGRIGVVTETSN